MREVMLIIHFIGLAMGAGTAFGFLFLGIASSKFEKKEGEKFMVNALFLGKMGQIGRNRKGSCDPKTFLQLLGQGRSNVAFGDGTIVQRNETEPNQSDVAQTTHQRTSFSHLVRHRNGGMVYGGRWQIKLCQTRS